MINQILNSGYKACLVITGGGTGVITRLLENGGGSKFLEAAFVPYSKSVQEAYLGKMIDRCVSRETVEDLAQRAYDPLMPLYFKNGIGVAASAKLISNNDRPDREYLLCMSIVTFNKKEYYEFSPSSKTRIEQERECEEFILQKILAFINENSGHE